MVSTRSSALLLATAFALALQGHADAAPCDADNYSKVATAVQTLHANCASWAAYLPNGGVWTCDSKCHDAVANLVDTLPDCTFGGPYGHNYKEVVESMVRSCGGQETSTSESTTAPSSTMAAPGATTETPSATTAAPSSTNESTNSTAPAATTKTESPTTENDDDVKASTSTSASASAGDAGAPASDVSTTSSANAQTATSVTAMLLVVAVSLLQ